MCLCILQAALSALLHQHFSVTLDSPQLQPLRDATPLVLLCSTFDPGRYLQTQPNARSLAADITAVSMWLSHLAESSSHSISLAVDCNTHSHAGSMSYGGNSASGGPSQCGGSTSAARNSSSSSKAPTMPEGLIEMEVGAARSALLKMAGATFGCAADVFVPNKIGISIMPAAALSTTQGPGLHARLCEAPLYNAL